MNTRFATTPPYRTDENWRLVWWFILVGFMIALAYATRATAGKPDPQVLYQWSTAAGGLVQDGIVLLFVLFIAGFSAARLALRRPLSIPRAAALAVGVVIAIYVFEGVYSAIVHPGNEQGLTPSKWEPDHAWAYIANAVVICTWVPFVEELTFRGLGFTLLRRFGEWPAILGVGVLFGLAHGLVLDLPVIAAFGCALAWLRSRTDSVYPGMVVHATFNLIALVAAVAT